MKEAYERILVVDDAPETLELLQRHLQAEGYRVFSAAGVAEAVRLLEEQPIDLVITDLKMPKVSGLDLVRHVRENLRETEVMMITGYASIEGAVTAVKLGADEYLAKPFLKEELLAAVERSLHALRLRRAGAAGQEPVARFGLVGESEAIRRVHAAVLREAGRLGPVLLTGDAGTGKEATARAVHYGGPRARRPFLVFRVGAIPAELVDTELFGETGPGDVGSAGFLQLAQGGTLYVDGVERLSPALQERLVPESPGDGAVDPAKRRRGPTGSGARVILGTAQDLPRLSERGKLAPTLRDLLEGRTVHLPPLRERGEDVLLLARHFLLLIAREAGLPAPRFSDRALAALREYHWPGNVGELKAVVGTLAATVDGGQIDVPDLPSLLRFSALRDFGALRSLAEVELQHIQEILTAVGGNKTKAAEILGIDRKTLREKLKSAGETVVGE
jgi:two-component system, NtrC family, response regulator HydG